MIWRYRRDDAVMVLLVVAVQLLGLGLTLGFEYTYLFRGVMRAYPLVAWVALAILLGFGIDWFLAHAGDRKRLALVAVLLAWIPGLWGNYLANDRHQDTLARDYARLVLTSLPDRSTLVMTSDFQVGPMTFLNNVRGLRPDLTLYETGNVYVTERLPGPSPTAAIAALPRERLFSIGVPQLEGEAGVRDFGYFVKVGDSGYERLPASADFTRRLAANYAAGYPRDPVSRYFAHQLLIALGVQLTAVVLQDGADEALLADLSAVQATFPGMLGSASATLTLAPGFPAKILRERLAPFATQIPAVASTAEIALFQACRERVSENGAGSSP